MKLISNENKKKLVDFLKSVVSYEEEIPQQPILPLYQKKVDEESVYWERFLPENIPSKLVLKDISMDVMQILQSSGNITIQEMQPSELDPNYHPRTKAYEIKLTYFCKN